jgi:hypothetical protein
MSREQTLEMALDLLGDRLRHLAQAAPQPWLRRELLDLVHHAEAASFDPAALPEEQAGDCFADEMPPF